MNLTYNISRNTSDDTITKIIKSLEAIEGIKCRAVYEALFKTRLEITIVKELTPDELLSLGALIGTIEANQYI